MQPEFNQFFLVENDFDDPEPLSIEGKDIAVSVFDNKTIEWTTLSTFDEPTLVIEPTVADFETVKVTKEYPVHNMLYDSLCKRAIAREIGLKLLERGLISIEREEVLDFCDYTRKMTISGTVKVVKP